MPVDIASLPQPSTPTQAYYAKAPVCQILTVAEANLAFRRLQARLPSTQFVKSSPSEVCGLVRLQLANGTLAYTDVTGRYFLLALSLDTEKGSPADASESIDRAITLRNTRPGAGLAREPE